MTRPANELDQLGYVLRVIGTMLSLDQVSSQVVELYGPADDLSLRTLANLAGQSPV
ncbi:MAG: hypothetical protein ABI140_04660 [Jatrophihabitantaceae bacterium]